MTVIEQMHPKCTHQTNVYEYSVCVFLVYRVSRHAAAHPTKYRLLDVHKRVYSSLETDGLYLPHVKFPLTKIDAGWEGLSEVRGDSLAHQRCCIY